MIDEGLLSSLLPELCRAAGNIILEVRSGGFNVDVKDDRSPVTLADTRAEAVILAGLIKAFPDIPVVAEEAMMQGPCPDISGGLFFLVDPLDGTKEFVAGFDDFTVNIALIQDGAPVAGCVFAPALNRLWYGATLGDTGLIVMDGTRRIAAGTSATVRDGPLRVTVSRVHGSAATERWIEGLGDVQRIAVGSSVKFCHLATGLADVYPRFAPTMEWDTAAGDAVLRAAGGQVTGTEGMPLVYGDTRADTGRPFENPDFIAYAPGVNSSSFGTT